MGEFGRIYRTDLSDRELMQFWGMVQAAGRDRAVSYCMEPQTPAMFASWMRRPGIEPWIIMFRGRPCGLFFLTDREGKTAQVHFCTLPLGTARTQGPHRMGALRGFGLYALGSVLWQENESGGHYIDTLVGVTPACNRRAVKFIHGCGAVDCGVVPGACWYHDTNENVPGVITIYTRESVPAWAASL